VFLHYLAKQANPKIASFHFDCRSTIVAAMMTCSCVYFYMFTCMLLFFAFSDSKLDDFECDIY